ncbi:MAG TPA: hypothetical protein VD913_05105 [bacterium]|nr:hypothetical protein [bacterium]
MNAKSIVWMGVIFMAVGMIDSGTVYGLDRPPDVPAGLSAADHKRLSEEKENLEFLHHDLEDRMDFVQDNCQGVQADPQNIIRCNTAQAYVQTNQTMYENRLETYESDIQALQSASQ